jgi:hypothetical protein
MTDIYASYPADSTGSSGTVTSVGLADTSTVPIYTITNSPVTGAGTIDMTLKTETANRVFAGPTTGAAAQPTFRAIVAADIPTGNLTDVGTDGIVITGGTAAVVGSGTSIAQHVADSTHNGYLSSTDWSTFNNKQTALTIGNLSDAGTDGIVVTGGTGSVIGSGTSIAQHVADASHNGYLSSTDWSTFNSKQAALTIGNLTDAGTDGITVTSGTGAVIGSGTSIAQHVADASHNGYLSSTDWSTFNNKQATITTGNLTDAGTDGITVTGGTGAIIGSGTSIAQQVADTTHNGYLSSTDWNTFNGKVSPIVSVSSVVTSGASLTTNTPVNVTSISVPAGKWLISGNIDFGVGGTTAVAILRAGVSKTSGTIFTTVLGVPSGGEFTQFVSLGTVPANDICIPIPSYIATFGSTTTLFLIAVANFSVSTCNYGSGYIQATPIT